MHFRRRVWPRRRLNTGVFDPTRLAVPPSVEFDLTRTPATAKVVAGAVSGHPELNQRHQELRLAPSYT